MGSYRHFMMIKVYSGYTKYYFRFRFFCVTVCSEIHAYLLSNFVITPYTFADHSASHSVVSSKRVVISWAQLIFLGSARISIAF